MKKTLAALLAASMHLVYVHAVAEANQLRQQRQRQNLERQRQQEQQRVLADVQKQLLSA